MPHVGLNIEFPTNTDLLVFAYLGYQRSSLVPVSYKYRGLVVCLVDHYPLGNQRTEILEYWDYDDQILVIIRPYSGQFARPV